MDQIGIGDVARVKVKVLVVKRRILLVLIPLFLYGLMPRQGDAIIQETVQKTVDKPAKLCLKAPGSLSARGLLRAALTCCTAMH